jgi:hypothetical protein
LPARSPRTVRGRAGDLLTASRRPRYILIIVTTAYSRARVDRLLRRIVVKSETRGIRSVLVDAPAVPVKPPTTDRYTLGADAALRLGWRLKVA